MKGSGESKPTKVRFKNARKSFWQRRKLKNRRFGNRRLAKV